MVLAVLMVLAVRDAEAVAASAVVVLVAVAEASDVQEDSKIKKKSNLAGYSFSVLSSMLSPSVGAISSSKSVMPALMRMLYHCISFLMWLFCTRS